MSPQQPLAPGYRVNIKRGANQPSYGYGGRSNNLFEGATAHNQRKSITDLCYDTTRNVSSAGRRTMTTAGRWLFSNFPQVSGTILEQVLFSTAGFSPQFWGKDKKWGDLAEEWLLNWEEIACVEGWPYDGLSYRDMLVTASIRCGDIGTLLTEYADGYPAIQAIPAHRIGGRVDSETYVPDGPYKDRRMFDGVIVNDQRRPLAFVIYDENGITPIGDPVPAENMFLSYIPQWPDQVRGFSEVASAIFDWQDLRESKSAELVAQKAASKLAMIENNEMGARDPMGSLVKTARTHNSDGTPSNLTEEKINDGTFRYFRSGSGSKIEAFSFNRPGAQVQQYPGDVLRDNVFGLMWSHFLSLNPGVMSGAAGRLIAEKLNRTIAKRQAMIMKALKRVRGYAISKAIKMGLLPPSDEWWKWESQVPAEMTADRKYDSDIAVQELANRITTKKRECARRGSYFEDTQDQCIREELREYKRTLEIAKTEFGMSEEEAKEFTRKPEQKEKPEAGKTIPNRTKREPVDDESEADDAETDDEEKDTEETE